MSKGILFAGIVGFLGGVFIMYSVRTDQTALEAVPPHMNEMQQNIPMPGTHGENMTMDDMTKALEGKSGDNFDKAFIEMMIDHHQGAVDMAEIAKRSAKHEEIKKMVDDIISTQTKEIDQMNDWYTTWNY